MNHLFRQIFNVRYQSEAADAEAPAGADAGGTTTGADPATEPAATDTPAEGDAPADKPVESDKPKEGDDKDKPEEEKDKKAEGAPEAYEFKAPEGQELDADAVKQFEPIARELNLNQEQAQKLVDLYGSKVMPQLMKQQAEVWQKQTADWADAAKADKEYGGDKFEANMTRAKQALDKFGTPELREYLESTGMGNNPELIRAFYKVGAAMSEDTLVTSNETGQRSAAEVLYGKK